MERDTEVEVVRQQLMGLVALLLSLAALADRASSISFGARKRSLVYLRMAESEFIAFIADVRGTPETLPDEGGNSVDDAARLAARLRALAIVVAGTVMRLFATAACTTSRRDAVAARAENGRAGKPLLIVDQELLPFDTS